MVHGTQQAVSLLARVLVDEDDPVAVEDPHYQLVGHALVAHGARLVPMRVDRNGLDCSLLPQPPERVPRFVLVTPSHQFPAGVELSLERRAALLRYAAAHGCWIVEDDYDGEFRYGTRPLAALK